jgi:hypothetical protein|tara:strand:+ start:6557 stop:6871 length:315 start_codon:yes stop_codon:yes gene_type:complete
MTSLIKPQPTLIQSESTFTSEHGGITQKHTQHISQSFLDDLKDARNESGSKPTGEMMRVASIPTAVVEKWMREGFNLWEADGKEIVKKLKAEHLDMFLTTEKRI